MKHIFVSYVTICISVSACNQDPLGEKSRWGKKIDGPKISALDLCLKRFDNDPEIPFEKKDLNNYTVYIDISGRYMTVYYAPILTELEMKTGNMGRSQNGWPAECIIDINTKEITWKYME